MIIKRAEERIPPKKLIVFTFLLFTFPSSRSYESKFKIFTSNLFIQGSDENLVLAPPTPARSHFEQRTNVSDAIKFCRKCLSREIEKKLAKFLFRRFDVGRGDGT